MDWAEHVYYCESSPTFLRRAKPVFSGKNYLILESAEHDVAGSLISSSEYAQVKINKRLYLCHRVVWELHHGEIPPGMFIDHKDGDRFNSNINNLRLATRERNARNAKLRRDNTIGYAGVKHERFPRKNGTVTEYYRAYWEEGGKPTSKGFNINKLGRELAFNLAVACREEAIARLNDLGYGYTERHGKTP